MGLVKKILALKKTEKISTFYSDYLSIELAEDFHIHFRNSRIEMDHKEFQAYCEALIRAYLRWGLAGRPKIGDIDNTGKQVFLSQSKIGAESGKENKAVNSDEIRVELQKWADYIHIHWKWLKLELSVDEFLEFAQVLGKAADELKLEADLQSIPRRTGKYHVACPRDRVDRREAGDFWVSKGQDNQLEYRHKTVFFSASDQNRYAKQRVEPNNCRKSMNSPLSNIFLAIIGKSKAISKLTGIRIR